MTDAPDVPRPRLESAGGNASENSGADASGRAGFGDAFAKLEVLRRNYGPELDRAFAAGTAPLKPMPGLSGITEPATILVMVMVEE